MKPSWRRSSLIYIAILIVAVALFSLLLPTDEKPTEIPLSEAIVMSQNNEIERIIVDEETLLITAIDGTELKTAIGLLTIVDLQELGLNLPEGGYEIKSGGFNWGILINFLPLILIGALLFFPYQADLLVAYLWECVLPD